MNQPASPPLATEPNVTRAAPLTPLVIRMMLTRTGKAVRHGSGFGRKAAFVLGHTLRRNMMVGVIARGSGHSTPDAFGVAPSTLAHRDGQSCAR